MKKLRFILAAALILGQLPMAAFAAPASSGGPVALSQVVQDSVTGGTCSTCNRNPDPKPPAEPPVRIGSPYWEHTRTRQVSHTVPTGQLVFQHNNYGHVTVTRGFSWTEKDSMSWSAGGGIPGGVIQASIGRTYDNSRTESMNVTIPGGYSYKHYISYPTTRYHHDFTRYQDWSDGSRQSLNSSSVGSSRISTRHGTQVNRL